jgi:hypothetical protein
LGSINLSKSIRGHKYQDFKYYTGRRSKQKGGKTLMERADQVNGFCRKQKSMTAALVKFVEWFMDDYEEEERAEQEILTQCVQQLFRKYYYSVLDPEMTLTPAKIVTTLCEREFGNSLMTVPVLDCTFKGKKITRLQYHFASFGTDNHPMVNDLTQFLEVAGAGMRMEKPGILCAAEYRKLKKNLWIFDRHYINLISLMALEAGYIECVSAGNQIIGQTVAKSQEYFALTNGAKLQRLLELAMILCSKTLIQNFPELQKEFSVLRIAEFLRNPRSFDAVMETVYKKMGLDLKRLDRSLLTGNFEVTLQSLNTNENNLIKLFEIQRMLDIYFFTPFGYYLQVIRPVYPDIYDLTKELDEILVDLDNFQVIRNKLFSIAIDFDLTILGELILGEDKKPCRKGAIPDRIGDTELCNAVLASTAYMKAAHEAFAPNDDEAEDYLQFLMDDPVTILTRDKGKKAKVIDFPTKKVNETTNVNDQVFVFKVKIFEAKRIWRQIEIRGAQSLHHLHQAIFEAFGFDEEHLYAFYLSNQFWDPTTEYAHPEAESRSAEKALISKLGLVLKQKIAYVFDFGEERRFEVELVALHEAEAQGKYPRESKRNKPIKTRCDACQSDQNPIEWYCYDHDVYLCGRCAQEEKYAECYLTPAIL